MSNASTILNNSNALIAPTNMSDELATKSGQKVYLYGVTYNSGIAPTLDISGLPVVGGAPSISANQTYFIPKQLQDGSWMLNFNVSFYWANSPGGDQTVGGSFFINGVSLSNFSNLEYEAVTGIMTRNGGGIPQCHQARVQQGVIQYSNSGTYNRLTVSGYVKSSKPTWAY